MSGYATFTGPGGSDARSAIRQEVHALQTITTGDLLYCGQVIRSRIRQRTFQGIDADGAPFSPYSTRGPYYFYPNGSVGSTRGVSGTRTHTQAQVRKARATAAKGRFDKTGRLGTRTPYGIRYESYAAAKSAHGATSVNLYGMEQHTHMLDTMLVKAGGIELDQSADGLMDNSGSPLAAFEQNQQCSLLTVGFFGPEAERAKGNNEGTKNSPPRKFFALNAEDQRLCELAIAERMQERARGGRG